MSNVKYDSIVNRAEAEALKEMIFKRARERAAALDSEVKTTYTSSVKNDIMDLARDSFVAERNPFTIKEKEHAQEIVKDEEPKKEAIGFPERKVQQIKANIIYRNKTSNEELANNAVNTNMLDARADFRKKESFMGALEFLNSQASVSLIKSCGKSFEALA